MHRQAPTTLRLLCPPVAAERQHQNTRTKDNLTQPRASTTLPSKSFFHTSPKLWNSLSTDTKNLTTIEAFKEEINKEVTPANPLFYNGTRSNQRLHARMRLKCSNLNSHLHDVGLKDSPLCNCGEGKENVDHYLLRCPTYTIQRTAMMDKINFAINISKNDLLYGNNTYSDVQNVLIFSAVHNDIEKSKRFDA